MGGAGERIVMESKFDRFGWDSVRVDERTLQRYEADICKITARVMGVDTPRNPAALLAQATTQQVQTIRNTIRLSEWHMRFVLHVADIIGAKVQGGPTLVHHSGCRIDTPADERGRHDWHQQSAYSMFGADQTQAWCPLFERSTPTIGAMEYLEKSHVDGPIDHELVERPGGAPELICKGDTERYGHRVAQFDRGVCMLFDTDLIHRSGCNTSDRARLTFVGSYTFAPDLRAYHEPYTLENVQRYHRAKGTVHA